MLILTRKPQESIVINDDITITLLKMNRHSIRIGIEAPKNVPIYRKEIYLKLP